MQGVVLMALDRNDILGAALTILDEYGLADLSMRRIAAHLGVRPGALYWHFENKQTLLAAVSDAILRGRTGLQDQWAPVPGYSVADVLHSWTRALRDALLAHRDGAELVASVVAMQMGEVSPVNELAELLPGPHAHLTAWAITHFVLGHCASEQAHAQMVELGVIAPNPLAPNRAAFDHGVELLVAGVQQQPEG